MPLALEFISSAVAMRLLLTSACFVCCVVTMSLPPGAESRLGTAIEESGSTLEALLNVEWSNDDLEALQNIMDEQVEIFRAQLLEHFENSAVHRGKRAVARVPKITGVRQSPNSHVNINSSQALTLPATITCFLWNERRFCILGDSIYFMRNGQVEHFLSGLPVGPGDRIKAHVYDEAIFIAIYNNDLARVRLYLLHSPGWKTLKNFQHIASERLKDCVFFEDAGTLYMALVIQQGPRQYSNEVGMHCVIYSWTGTMMDMVQMMPLPDLRQIVVLQDDTTHLIMIIGNSSIQRWAFNSERGLAEPIEMLQVNISFVHQVIAFTVASRWCLLLAGTEATVIYTLERQQLLQWQVIQHRSSDREVSWMHIEQEEGLGGFDAAILILNLFTLKPGNSNFRQFEFYVSDASGRFSPVFTAENVTSLGTPLSAAAFLEGPQSQFAHLYVTALTSFDNITLEGFDIELAEKLRDEPQPDPLLQCMSDVEALIGKLSEETVDRAQALVDNMVLVHDDFAINGTVILSSMDYEEDPSFGTIQVLYNFTGDFNGPQQIEWDLVDLEESAEQVNKELAELLYPNSTILQGSLELTGTVEAVKVNVPVASMNWVNDRNWTEFADQAWRYSIPQIVDGDLTIDMVSTDNVTVGYTIGVTNPDQWLLQSGSGVFTQPTILSRLEVGGNITIGDHTINGVSLSDVVVSNRTSPIRGVKHFAKMQVQGDISVEDVNGRDFSEWAKGLVLQQSDEEQHLTGTVRVMGPIIIDGVLNSHFVNGVNVSLLAESLVNKSSGNVVKGMINFTSPVTIVHASLQTLNGVPIDDLLSTSGDQAIGAAIEVDVVNVIGELDCHDINGVDLSDLLYVDGTEEQIVVGRVRFESDVEVGHMVMENGTLNDLDVIDLLDPPSLRIDSPIHVTGDWKMASAVVAAINDTDLRDLRSHFWTKSTDQTIPTGTDVRMPFDVFVTGNVTTHTFLGRPLDGSNFYMTAADETLDFDLVFSEDVVVIGNMTVDNLKSINNVSLQSFADDVVLKTGTFQLIGTKTFQRLSIHGDLKVEDRLNDKKIPEDVALLDRPAQELSDLVFDADVTVSSGVLVGSGNVVVNVLADLVLDDFIEDAVMIDEDAVISGDLHIKRHLDVDELHVVNLLNGRHIDDIVNSGITQSGKDPLKLSQLTVRGQVTFLDSLKTDKLNGHDVDEYLGQVVDITRPGRITGTKTARMVDVAEDAEVAAFNGVELRLSTVLTASSNQTITGEFVLKHISADSMKLDSINGHNVSDYVQTAGTTETQFVEGKLEVEDVDVKGPLSVQSQVINGCRLQQYLGLADVTQLDRLTIADGNTLMLEQPWDNNPELAALLFEVLRTDRDEAVSGHVSLQAEAFMDSLSIPDNHIDGVNLDELFNGSMLKSVEQNVSGVLEFADRVVVDKLENVGRLEVMSWNGQDVHKLVEGVVLMNKSQTIRARKTISGPMEIRGNLNVTGSIDSVPVKSLMKTREAKLPPGTQFESLVIRKELNVTSGLIGGVNLTSFLAKRVPLKGDAVISANVVFNDSVSADSISAANINGLSMTDLVLKTASPGQIITGRKVLKAPLDIDGDVIVSNLNGRNPEELTAFMVLKDEDAEFEKPVTFNGGLSVMKQLDVGNYNGKNLSQLLSVVSANVTVDPTETKARSLLTTLQKSTAELADFEYFEQIQHVSFSFPHGSNVSMHVHHCPIPIRRMANHSETAAGILVATHSSDGNSCGLKRHCRCHQSVSMPTDALGRLNTLRMPTRLKEYLDSKLAYGDRVRLLSSQNQLFIVSIETLPGCVTEMVSIAVLHPVTLKMTTEVFTFNVNDTVVDVALEQRTADGLVFIAIAHSVFGVKIYSFDGRSFQLRQLLETERISSIDMIPSTEDSSVLFLAVASYGLDTMSSIWTLNQDGQFDLLKDFLTVGATDIAFSEWNGDMYLTVGQDPSSIDPFSESWTQFKVPAQVLYYAPSVKNFELFQLLDIDRVTSVANLNINGSPFMAAATFNGRVRIYRLIRGQGFQPEQTFRSPGIKSISSYSIRNETYLAAVTESRTMVYIARLRGFQKPSVRL